MLPEIGQVVLAIACMFSLLQVVYPLYGIYAHQQSAIESAKILTVLQFVFVALSFIILAYLFLVNDFTVAYIATNSNSAMPWYYRLSAVWGAHEGSLLLWVLLLSMWSMAVALMSKRLPVESVARVLAVLGLLSLGFYLFVLLTSNPFDRTLPYFPVDGRDLNPLLQDIGLIFHPPMLYMGYVGFSVAFAFAIAALMEGRLDSAWAKWSRPWTIAAWTFLTLGIALGSWWAYYELGWGGWWFWDPVENASFMPWLAGTALIHSLAVSEKRGVFKSWTVLLAISAFSLSLLGTFLVRSGVLVSVHAFASDPTRGLFILTYLILVIGGSLLLYAVQASKVKSRGRYSIISRETMLLSNNILLIAALIVVLLGTLLPLVHKEMGLGSISIGEPFFNRIFTVLIVPFALFLGVGSLVRWQRQNLTDLFKPMVILLVVSTLLTLVFLGTLASHFTWLAVLGIFLAMWILTGTCVEIYLRSTHRFSLWTGMRKLGNSHWAMTLGHAGFAIMLIGITMTQNFSIERDVKLSVGESVRFEHYDFHFDAVNDLQGKNYGGIVGKFTVKYDQKTVAVMEPEKRIYNVQRTAMTEAAIDSGFTRDLYIAMGEVLPDGAWSVRVYYKSFIRWIWFGPMMMALAGVLVIFDRRYRVKKVPESAAEVI
ncbi:cytochrome c-type biogenesis protein CcmF [Psychromonas ingrahamii 37]|uniref:Cytochrome c-type biogenesis protein CcmF n=1 Tax=Psychromonas ingrahamii (strain DSM 17664 / CCUG 51855 / 37) TaxID=357804 RepID=A1SZ06_PSYIN|nr:heme lyase CcmF/NrfE family subunit [Psychromonas ingrahamii]ABM04721.1 cytochrome c-type biogenesis protein CcmF [Psychromonas ingrahamii 37]